MENQLLLTPTLIAEQARRIQDFIEKAEQTKGIIFKLDLNLLDVENTYVQHILLEGNEGIEAYAVLSCYSKEEMEVTIVTETEREPENISRLIARIVDEGKKKDVERILFIAEEKDSFLMHLLVEHNCLHVFSEFRMKLNATKKRPAIKQTNLVIQPATSAERRYILTLDEEDSAIRLEHLEKELAEVEIKGTLLAHCERETIGKLRLDETDESIGIYAFVVAKEWRGKGYGRSILQKVIEETLSKEMRKIFLEVNSENEVALNLYKSVGFEKEASFNYYNKAIKNND